MYKLLNNNIRQLNIGDVQGTLYNSFNIDLKTNVGKIGGGTRTILTTDSLTNMGVPIGFKYFDGHWFTVAGTRVFMNDGTPKGVFSADTSTGFQTNFSSSYSDINIFNGNLVVTTTSGLYTKASASGLGTGAYTSRRTFAVSGASPAHMTTVYFNRLYWVDTRGQIFSMDTAFTSAVTTATQYTLKVPDGFDIIWMQPHSAGLYIGLMDVYGTNGKVLDWNGVTADTIRAEYKVDAQASLAGYVDSNGVLFQMNSNAILQQFSGGGFKNIARLPIKQDLLYKATNIILNDRFIHPNGLTQIDASISCLINAKNNTSSGTQLDNINAGIYEYISGADGFGTLYHKHSFSYLTTGGTITDYGQVMIAGAGGLADVADIYETADASKGNFLAGAAYYSDPTTVKYGIWTDDYYDTKEKAGYFSTIQLKTQRATEMFNQLITTYNPTAGNKYTFKYRTRRYPSYNCTVRWFSGTQFTTTQTGLTVGDEITVIQGTGSGRCSHITRIEGTTNYIITIDSSIPATVNSYSIIRVEKWKKIEPEITKDNLDFAEVSINNPGARLEIKVAMVVTGRDAVIEEMELDNKKYK